MPITTGLTDDEAQAIADRVLRRSLPAATFDRAEVRSGPDHDGDQALFVTAFLNPGSGVIQADAYALAHGAMDEAFREAGETRFPYFRLSRPDEPVEEHDDADAA